MRFLYEVLLKVYTTTLSSTVVQCIRQFILGFGYFLITEMIQQEIGDGLHGVFSLASLPLTPCCRSSKESSCSVLTVENSCAYVSATLLFCKCVKTFCLRQDSLLYLLK